MEDPDLSAADLGQPIAVRLFFRNDNLTENRIGDTDGVGPDEGKTGLDFYALSPGHPFANWLEVDTGGLMNGITYRNAPGLTFDANTLTKDIDTSPGNFTFLGTELFRDLEDENHLPVGKRSISSWVPEVRSIRPSLRRWARPTGP